MPSASADAVIGAWRLESARLIGALTRQTGSLDLAEDLAQDAMLTALEQWPKIGIPDNPSAWLMAVAKRRAIDTFRRAENLRRKTEEIGHRVGEEGAMPDPATQVDFIEDDTLRLIFLTCHPRLTPESRAALTLRLVGGLTTAEIARSFLTTESTISQRISRAKKTLREAGAEFELPAAAERVERLDDVMAIIYLIFNEGYSATAGEDWIRPELTNEAIRLVRMLAALMPDEVEVHGLQALLELQGSRTDARVGADGQPILLDDQDRARWDELLIRRGLAALTQAEDLARRGKPIGPYFLQASIASHHARAARAEDTDWRTIAALYDVLAANTDNPVVEVNRAVAHGRAHSPEAGLAVLDGIPDGQLAGSHLFLAVRADLLARAGRPAEAAQSFRAASAMTQNHGERTLLLKRAAECADGSGG